MQHLTEKQLSNLSVEQLNELRREVGISIGSLKARYYEDRSVGDYKRMRKLEKYLVTVKAVLQHKRRLNL
ncbi:hypothetical protein AVV36_gp116 [Pectobacterium bacteriophage PM2]|uniref:Uncharacterized protein n=1 Tax=Pectobacterium bacteriophage PM2 TaxID=1429794 RepID=A0A0A0Q0N1_9CAUD|nr:hypothetical protein AVV36_gp116 [Pectobacterium bacteriophage PM2]AHY25078.1 hypothetical protein PM2_116 [Pectobacterium bacteriophage PM2]